MSISCEPWCDPRAAPDPLIYTQAFREKFPPQPRDTSSQRETLRRTNPFTRLCILSSRHSCTRLLQSESPESKPSTSATSRQSNLTPNCRTSLLKQDGYTLLFAVTSQMFPRSRDLTSDQIVQRRCARRRDQRHAWDFSSELWGNGGWLAGRALRAEGPLNRFPSFNRLSVQLPPG